jgi:hypothetical protein
MDWPEHPIETDAKMRPMPTLTRTLLSAALLWAAAMPAMARETAQPVRNSASKSNMLQDTSGICARAIASVERMANFPGQLLLAISLTETGRWDSARRVRFAWPWTVTAGGSGRYFATKKQAVDHVRALRARGIRNIDVGCMQVNLRYHPNAFANLEQAFDPNVNVAYAGDLVQRLRVSTLSWAQAVRQYHSSRWDKGRKYWRKFVKIWRKQSLIAAEKTRLDRIDFLRKRQIARRRAALYRGAR